MDTRTQNPMSQGTTGENIAQMGEQAREGAERLRESGREAANRLSNAWQHTRDTIQERSRAGAEATDRTVREHPYASIGVAFCAGLILGVLLTRGNHY